MKNLILIALILSFQTLAIEGDDTEDTSFISDTPTEPSPCRTHLCDVTQPLPVERSEAEAVEIVETPEALAIADQAVEQMMLMMVQNILQRGLAHLHNLHGVLTDDDAAEITDLFIADIQNGLFTLEEEADRTLIERVLELFQDYWNHILDERFNRNSPINHTTPDHSDSEDNELSSPRSYPFSSGGSTR